MILLLFTGTCCKKGAFNLSHKPFERIFKLMEHALYKQMTVRAHCSGRVKNTLTCTYTCMMSQCCVPAPILRELIASPAPNKLKRLAHETRCVSSGTDTQLLDIVFVHRYTLTQKWYNNHNMKWVYHIAGKSTGK